MKKTFIIAALVLLLALYIQQKITAAKQLEFAIGIPLQISVRSGSLTFLLPLKVQNVSPTSLRIRSLDLNILSAGQKIGKALLTSPVTIAPSNFTVLNVSVSVNPVDVLQGASAIVKLFKAGMVSLTLDGYVYAEGFRVPLVQDFALNYKNLIV